MSTMELIEQRSRGMGLAVTGVIGFAVALSLASQVSIPIPGTPVPLTLQPMFVVLAGLMLGPRLGALAVGLWVVAGALGLPVFTPGGAPGLARLIGPTGGYIVAAPAAAFVAGLLAVRATGFRTRLLAALVGMLVIYTGGMAQLAVLTGSLSFAAVNGVLPFAVADAAKAVVAATVARTPLAGR